MTPAAPRAPGFVPPPYPYDRLDRLVPTAARHDGGVVDLSIGTPVDAPPPAVIEAFSTSGAERGYPASIGTAALREAVSRWLGRRFDIEVDPAAIGASVGSKEFVGTLPQWLHLRSPDRDTILYPSVSYPTYEMGAILAGCRPVAVAMTAAGRLDLDSVDPRDADRALALWVNSPGNPSGAVDDLGAIAEWGRHHGVPVFSDECYVEFTWDGRGRSILEHGLDGVVAVHSLSKRSNLAGARVAHYAGDPGLVRYLQEVRKHVGMMVPGPAQAAAVVALDDDEHVEAQRQRYRRRLARTADILGTWSGRQVPTPAGGFYLWFPVGPGGDARLGAAGEVGDGWEYAARLADVGGALVSPGEFYGPSVRDHVRVAVVQPDERIELVARRLGV